MKRALVIPAAVAAVLAVPGHASASVPFIDVSCEGWRKAQAEYRAEVTP